MTATIDADKPPSTWRRRLYGIGMSLGLLLFAWQLVSAFGNLRRSGASIAAAPWLLAALALAVAGYLLQFSAWLLVMRFLGSPLPPAKSFAGYYLSFMPRYIPGTVWGYLGRSEWLYRQFMVGYRQSSIGSLLEAGSFVATALLIAAWTYLRFPLQVVSMTVLALGGPLGWLLLLRAAHGTVRPHWWLMMNAFVIYFLYWGVQGLILGAVCRALDLAANVDLLHLIAAAAASWSIGFLALFVPAGFGVRELSLSYLLTTQSQLAPGDANLIAVLSRLCMIVAELLLLCAAFVLRRREADQPLKPPGIETSEL